MSNGSEIHWFVGAIFNSNDDQLDRFLSEGIWEIHNPNEADRSQVLNMKAGDQIAIKSAFVQKNNLPFDNKDQSISVMRIKARGRITENFGDGARVKVKWEPGFDSKDWYFFTNRNTIWNLSGDREEASQLIAFAFDDAAQDYDWFIKHPYWRERFVNRETEGNQGSVWIEKTLVKGRSDRENGDNALGAALWSPQKSKNGGDIYSNMRKVKKGDVVLHLTDNQSFTGISIVDSDLDDTFTGIAGSDWEGKCYRIALSGFQKLEPPLARDDLLKTEPFASELSELVQSGMKGLFYNNKLELNQGAYLTEATPTLRSILARAYFESAGKYMPHIGRYEISETEAASNAEPYSIEDALGSLFLEKGEVEEILLLWQAKKNIILQGPPGVGKSFAAEKLAFALMGDAERDRIGFVQFHQSYSYEDFVEGFKPTETGFDLKAGKFVQFCRRAEADPDNRYVFIIDEINRGNLSKILGELMLLIEGDKRGPDWAMALAAGKVKFHVPPNVYLIGLMNTADRSLAIIDYALRRRFAFINLKPKIEAAKFAIHLTENGIEESLISQIVVRIGELNQEIVDDTLNFGPGFAIGHSYFCSKPLGSETPPAWYNRIIRTEISPLLREYWFDAPSKADAWETRLLTGQ